MGACTASQGGSQRPRGQEQAGYRDGRQPRQPPAVQAPRSSAHTRSLLKKSLVQVRLRAYLNKKTIELRPKEPYLHEYTVTFSCTSDSGCLVHVYFFCSEDKSPLQPQFSSKRPFSGSEGLSLQAGENQLCSVAFPDFFRASLLDLTFGQQKIYPLTIVVTPFEAENEEYQAQVTYAKFQVSETELKLVPIRQRVLIGKKSVEAMEMYGLHKGDEAEDNCAICLSEPQDTAVLPCNHLCICIACAGLLLKTGRPKCPICRGPASSYMKLVIS